MAGEISKRNGQKGGRPKGKKNQTTLEKEAILEAIKQRIFQKGDQLIGAQFSIAEGCSYLFKIIHYKEGKGKKSKHVLVKDPERSSGILMAMQNPINTTSSRPTAPTTKP